MTIVEKPLNPENGRCIGAETDASEPVGEEPVGEAPVARNVDDPAERDNVVLDAKPVEVLGRRPDKIPVADSVEVSIIDDGDTIVNYPLCLRLTQAKFSHDPSMEMLA